MHSKIFCGASTRRAWLSGVMLTCPDDTRHCSMKPPTPTKYKISLTTSPFSKLLSVLLSPSTRLIVFLSPSLTCIQTYPVTPYRPNESTLQNQSNMRFLTVIVGLAASFASADFLDSHWPGEFSRGVGQKISRIPILTDATSHRSQACVGIHGCIVQAEMHSTCDPFNNSCLCKDDYYLRTSTTCIQSYCSAEDFATAAKLAQQLCKAAVRAFSPLKA